MCSVSESCTSFAFAFVMVGERALCRYEVRSGRGEASSAETGLESALQFSQRAYISEYFRKQNAFTCTPALKFSLNSLQMFGITVLMNYYPLHRTLLTSPVWLVRCWFISYHGSVVRSSSCKFSCGQLLSVEFSECVSAGSGVGSALGERGHGSAYLQVSGVPRNGWCALLCHECDTRQHTQSDGQKQTGVYVEVEGEMFIDYVHVLFSLFYVLFFCPFPSGFNNPDTFNCILC